MESLHHKHSLNFPMANVVAVALCYLIGFYGLNVLFVIPIFTVLFTYWNQCYEAFAKCVLLQAEYMEAKKRVLKNGESLEWVNHAIDRWWTCCNVSIGRFVKDWIEPIVEQFKFPIVVESMKILAFDTGLYRPRFSNLRLLQPVKQPSGYSKNGPPLQTYTHVTLDTLTTPHYVMATENWSALEFEVDADFNVPLADFKIRAKIGRGNISQNLLLNVGSFHVGGTVRCVVKSDKNTPFPHISTADICFVPKPVVECTCRALKDVLEVTDVPGMKQMVQKYIIMGFKRLLVDPGKQHIDFTPAPLPGPEWSTLADGGLSRGVLTVTIESSAKDDSLSLKGRGFEPNQYCKLRLGDQRCIRHFNSLADPWSSTFSFLVRKPEEEKLVVKLKAKRRLVRDFMTAHFSIPLLDVCEGDSATRSIKRFPVLAEDDVEKLYLSLLYTPLPTLSLLNPAPFINRHITEAGVLYVHVHAAKNVRAPTPSLDNVFCCVTWGEKTILRTHTLPGSCDPVWEKGIELIVPSCNGIHLEFNVLSESQGMATNSLIGSAFLSLNENETHLVQHRLSFTSYSKGRMPMSLNSPSLFVSVIFRHVESVNWTRESLKETFISRTRRRNAASCLDLTTNFMNPVGRGFGFSPHLEEDSRGMSLEDFSSSGESSYTKDSVSVSSY